MIFNPRITCKLCNAILYLLILYRVENMTNGLYLVPALIQLRLHTTYDSLRYGEKRNSFESRLILSRGPEGASEHLEVNNEQGRHIRLRTCLRTTEVVTRSTLTLLFFFQCRGILIISHQTSPQPNPEAAYRSPQNRAQDASLLVYSHYSSQHRFNNLKKLSN